MKKKIKRNISMKLQLPNQKYVYPCTNFSQHRFAWMIFCITFFSDVCMMERGCWWIWNLTAHLQSTQIHGTINTIHRHFNFNSVDKYLWKYLRLFSTQISQVNFALCKFLVGNLYELIWKFVIWIEIKFFL